MMGVATGVALAAIMGLLVESIDDRRSKGTTAPLVRIALALSAIVVVFVIVFVRFDLLAS